MEIKIRVRNNWAEEDVAKRLSWIVVGHQGIDATDQGGSRLNGGKPVGFRSGELKLISYVKVLIDIRSSILIDIPGAERVEKHRWRGTGAADGKQDSYKNSS